ncbi:MAG: Gfo/Idh/MocA family oxidoreductase [Planctomycetes bacterium]|nr:Gfo/Idh/MocA family oxidoreductase [Planctomycetota bacterium]MBL7044622.1 Gfo/Idh/MocA family oxidoreductase [Pirellulaceae bacterium]
MTKYNSLTRRGFLKQSLTTGAMGLVVPRVISSRALAAPGRAGANDRIGVGYIGLGARGNHILHHLPEDAEIVAVCDVDARRVAKAADGRRYATYGDYRGLLDNKDVDAVVITTPDHWHALQSIHACQAGKDVFCDKPLSLTVAEGRAMIRAARESNCIYQVGPQQRSIPAAIYACEFVRAGKLGKIREVHVTNNRTSRDWELPGEPIPDGLDWDMWLGPSAKHPFHSKIFSVSRQADWFGWMAFRPWSGGMMTSWGAHGMDLMQWGLGMDASGPSEVEPLGEGLTCELQYTYPNDVVVKLDEAPQGGAIFVGEKGKVTVACGMVTWDPPELGKDAPESITSLFPGATAPIHTRQWLKCVRSRQTPTCDVEVGQRTATACHIGNIARWLGRKVRWDPVNETFPGDDEASAMLSRPMRQPWHL